MAASTEQEAKPEEKACGYAKEPIYVMTWTNGRETI